MTKQWTDDMGEISGFGGSYEDACRAMVLAGIKWLDEHPEADPKFESLKFGLTQTKNADAEALEQAILDARVIDGGREIRVGEEATGAMVHASLNHVFAYKRLGWDEYCRQLRERS